MLLSHPSESIDDEYARAGIRDPKLVITTSRDPSSRLNQFVKELRLVFPNAQKLNRGNYVLKQLVETCRANEVTDLVLVHEHRGEPDGLVVCHLPYGPTAYFGIMNAVLRHDLKERSTVSQQFPHLIFHKFDSKLGERVRTTPESEGSLTTSTAWSARRCSSSMNRFSSLYVCDYRR
jgi:U3 small nucleolar ribonucleoprotein protein IMP4